MKKTVYGKLDVEKESISYKTADGKPVVMFTGNPLGILNAGLKQAGKNQGLKIKIGKKELAKIQKESEENEKIAGEVIIGLASMFPNMFDKNEVKEFKKEIKEKKK